MFDVIPRWALALGIGAISAAGVTTVALESLGSNHPACAEAHSAVVDASSCAKGDAVTGAADSAATGALASIDQLKAQLTSSVSGAQSQVEGIVANAKSQVATAST